MNKKKAMTLIYDKYDEIKKIVYKLDIYYFKTKGMYYEDITHDLLIKIKNQVDKLEDKPDIILKFIDKILKGQMYIIYNQAKQIFINFLKRENKYVTFNHDKLTKRENEKLIYFENIIKKNNIQEKVDEYIKTFYWFDQKLFDLYRYEFKMHKTKMSKKTKISYETIFRTVKRCKMKIKNKFKEDYKQDYYG